MLYSVKNNSEDVAGCEEAEIETSQQQKNWGRDLGVSAR
jgi:hypothetical protein